MQCKNNLTENENLGSTETCDNYTHSMCDDTCDILNINVYTCTKDIKQTQVRYVLKQFLSSPLGL